MEHVYLSYERVIVREGMILSEVLVRSVTFSILVVAMESVAFYLPDWLDLGLVDFDSLAMMFCLEII